MLTDVLIGQIDSYVGSSKEHTHLISTDSGDDDPRSTPRYLVQDRGRGT